MELSNRRIASRKDILKHAKDVLMPGPTGTVAAYPTDMDKPLGQFWKADVDLASAEAPRRPSDIPPLWRDDRGPLVIDLAHEDGFETGDPLPQLQRVGMLETPVLQAFWWRPPEIVAKIVVEVSSRFNKLQHPSFVSH